MLVGYARVSTADQNSDLQKDALEKAGCERIFTDVASGAQADRAGLAEALAYLRQGDTLVVWKLDRLGRSLKHLIETVQALVSRGLGLRSLQEQIDTTTSGGKLIFHVFGALAEFERDLIRERTRAGLLAARARGRKGGRPRVLDPKQAAMAAALLRDPQMRVSDICDQLKVSKSTLYRYVKARDAAVEATKAGTVGLKQSGREKP
jgi:DNA invertase Pin-like site-specific DNA recombinase